LPDIPAELLTRGGPWGLIALFFLLYFTGRVLPLWVVEKLLDAARERAADLEAARLASEEARRVQAQQLTELLELARTTDAVIRALPRPKGDET